MIGRALQWQTGLGLVLWTAAGAPAAPADRPLGDMTGPWQLFVDDHLVAARSCVRRTYHPFRKYEGNPILVPDRPWEKDVVSVNSVLPAEDASGYRMWYYCWAPKGDPDTHHSLYAVSDDGIRWTKPELNVVPWKVDGSARNNLVAAGASVMHTPRHPDPDRRYHSVTGGRYFVSASPDGIRWTRLKEEPVIDGGDVGWFRHDPRTDRFLAYVKVNAVVSGLRRRAVGFSWSEDPTTFPPLRLIMAPDDLDDRWTRPGSVQRAHFYGCPVFPYESMFIGLLWVFRAEDDEGYFHGPTDTQLVTSRDGVHWRRQEGDRRPLLERGKPRAWDGGMIAGMSLLRVGDELRLYYAGYDGPHDYLPFHAAVGLATLRKDGFASLDAGDAPGEVRTWPLQGARGDLRINARTDPDGQILVEVLDASGDVVPGWSGPQCDPFRGDAVQASVTWGGRAGLPEGCGPLAFRFLMRNASLFSMNAGEPLTPLRPPSGPPLQALYTFEGRRPWTDVLAADDLQPLRPLGTARIDRDPGRAGFGSASVSLGSPWHPLHRLEIGGTSSLGTAFTLAAMVRPDEPRHARLFSAYSGNGPVRTSELLFDFDPRGRVIAGLRLIARGIPVESQPLNFADEAYHHLAVTFDEGHVRFFLDGNPAGEAWLPGGEPVVLCRDLLVGEDLELGWDEQLLGRLDDILVLGRALSPAEIARLRREGAHAVLAGRGPASGPGIPDSRPVDDRAGQ